MTRSAIPFLAVLAMACAVFMGEPVWAARAATKPAAPAAKLVVDPVTDLIAQSKAAQAKGDTDLALRLAQSAIVADPSRTDAYVTLGKVYEHAGQVEFARNYYEEALSIEPLDADATRAIAALNTDASTTANAAQ